MLHQIKGSAFFVFAFLLSCLGSSGQQTLNSVRTLTAQRPFANEADILPAALDPSEVVQSTQYSDGLGRPVQTVIKKMSPAQKDLVDMHVYDNWGREVQKLLPFVSNVAQSGDVANDGNYKTDASAQQAAFSQGQYTGETYYYSKVDFENSPLNRVQNTYAPGNSWVGSSRATSVQYLLNTTTDNVRAWATSNTVQGTIPTTAAPYTPGALYKFISTDEQNRQTITFKDQDGNIVLKKVQQTGTSDNGVTGTGHAGWLCTYYVYDDYNNLRFVITPKVVGLIDGTWTISQSLADELCIRYEYDLLNRMVIKKMPGAAEQWLVYDQRGRLVMTQDANLRGQQKWQYFVYDNLDRAVSTGLISDPTNYNNRTFHQSNASSSIAYPNVASYTSELLTQTYYDNYSWTGTASMSASIDQSNTSNTTYFYAPSNTSSPYAQSIVQTSLTRGVITGSKTEVLGSSGSQYLYTVNFYDSKGRNIQTQGKNLTGGLDVVTTQYSWGGAALRTLEQHSKSGANSQSHVVLTKMSYDHAGRTLNVTKTIYSTIGANVFNSGERQVYTNTYDELGQVKTKSLGYSQVTNAALDVLTYDYNIRGWLTGINKNYTLSGSNSNSFGMELAYDKTTSTNGTTSFAASQYGGNITGVIWKSKGDGVARKYDYTYDNTDQLTSAAFSQNTSGSTWDNTYLDFSVKSIVYDLNGNIQSLKQNGFILGNVNSTLDDLTYNYLNSGASNKLKNVLDNANAAGTKLGDFHYAGTKTTTAVDYNYDNNGNLTADANKTITTLAYNVLNLPSVITLPNGTITYTYDAAGNKLRKTVQENNASVAYQGTSYITNITSTTTYIGGFVYYSKSYSNPSLASLNASEALQFVTHEAGRARLVTLASGSLGYAFDYFVRDNLGSIRVILTDEQQQDTYPAATLEPTAIGSEQAYYSIVNDASHIISASSLSWYSSVTGGTYPNNNGVPAPPDPTVNRGANSTQLYKLNGATGDRYGLGIGLKVMAGDAVNVMGRSLWHSNGQTINNTSYLISNILSTFIGSFAGTSAVTVGSKGTATSSVLNGNSATTTNLNTWLGQVPTPSGAPKAYINWILFDEQFKPVAAGSSFDPINTTADVVKPHSNVVNIVKSGYLYVYCSNESNQDVYFDNLQVVLKRGPMLEERHYYPGGLAMAGISSRAFNKLQTNFGYQGKEMQNGEWANGAGLEEYDFDARYYDPQLSRWHNQDPAGQFSSPYNAMGNNWPNGVDPTGKIFGVDDILIAAAIGAAISSAMYVGTNFAMGNSWNDLTLKGFATSAGMGALGGALGAGFTAAGTALFGESFASSFGYNFMSNIATNMGVNAAFGSKITWGTVAGSAFGAMLDGAMPNFRGFASGKSYSFWDAIENGVGELAINGAKGAFTGGMSGAIGAAIDGGDVSAGFTNGMRTGVIAAGLRTGLNIVVLGTTIRPSGVSTSLSAMEKDLGIKLNSNPYGPVYRTGAIWRRGLSVGLTHMINDGEGDLDDRRTWVHESYHYFQNLKQGWWRQLWNGAYEQWIMQGLHGINPYTTPGTNEYGAYQYEISH